MLLASALAFGHFTVHAPPSIAGSYPDRAGTFSPTKYEVTAALTLAASCPCSWLDGRPSEAELEGLALLLPDALCDETCTAAQAACAAGLYNVSALLISERFNKQTPDPPPSPPGANAGVPMRSAKEIEKLQADRKVIEERGQALGCSPLVPASQISSNMSSVIAAVANWSATVLAPARALGTLPGASDTVNVTIRRHPGDEPVDCTRYENVPMVYVIAVPVWLGLTIAWGVNTYRVNAASARDLHRLMCWVPVMEFVHGLLSLFNYFSCPWESILSLVYATFWSIVTILKEPVMLLCLLLVAKGWCITRHYLHRREVCVAGAILALLYASVSVQMSLPSPLSTVPMVIMYLAMLVEIGWSIWNNLRVLKAQILALRALGVDPITTPAHKKYMMFRRLAVFTALYALLELIVHWAFSNGDGRFWLFLTLHQLMELVIAVGIGYTFRAQPFNILFQQVQQVAAELADQMLPSITTIEVKPDMLQGDNLVAWRSDLGLGRSDPHLPPTLVVLNPGDTELPQMPATRAPLPLPAGMPPSAQPPVSIPAGGLSSASLSAARRAVSGAVSGVVSAAPTPSSPARPASHAVALSPVDASESTTSESRGEARGEARADSDAMCVDTVSSPTAGDAALEPAFEAAWPTADGGEAEHAAAATGAATGALDRAPAQGEV